MRYLIQATKFRKDYFKWSKEILVVLIMIYDNKSGHLPSAGGSNVSIKGVEDSPKLRSPCILVGSGGMQSPACLL